MSWLRVLVELWRGDPGEEYRKQAEEDREESKHVLEEAKQVVAETRAMLDGEDCWLIPPNRKSRSG